VSNIVSEAEKKLEGTVDKIMRKYKIKMFLIKLSFIIILLLYVIGIPFILYYIFLFFHKFGINTSREIQKSFYLSYFIGLIFATFSILANYKNERKINSKQKLYYWLDDLRGGEEFLTNTFKLQNSGVDILNNLEMVRCILLEKCENNVSKLILLKDYFNTLKENGKNIILLQTILTAIISVCAFLLEKAYFKGFLNFISIKITVIDLIIYFGSFVYLVTKELNRNMKKYTTIINILNQCIDEKNNK
jgi:phage shock protein PspC (stress-responsive transcriptional regulator)